MERFSMIDTIRISSMVSSVVESEFDSEIRTIEQKTGEIKTKLITKSGVRLTYYPVDNSGIMLAEVSIPKLVKGNNYELISNDELKDGLNVIEARINKVCECKSIGEWHVSRLDSVMSWCLGEDREQYIKYFRTLPVSGYTLTGYTKGKREIGSSWIAYFRRINAYDKDVEQEKELGGLLRLEVQDRNSASVRTLSKRIKTDQKVKNIVNNDVARGEVVRWLERTKAEDYINNEESLFETLLKEYGSSASEIYFFYAGYKKYGSEIKSKAGYSDSTYYRLKRGISKINKSSPGEIFKRLKV